MSDNERVYDEALSDESDSDFDEAEYVNEEDLLGETILSTQPIQDYRREIKNLNNKTGF